MTEPGKSIELYRAPGEGGELSGLDARLLEIVAEAGGRISGEEMAKKLNVSTMTPARCLQRAKEILQSQDLFSLTEQKALILLDVIRLRDILFERVEGTDTKLDRDGRVVDLTAAPAWSSALIRLLREWRSIIDSMKVEIDSDQLQIRQAHADIMMEAITLIFENFLRALDKFVEVNGRAPSRLEANDIMEESLPIGFNVIEHRTAA